MKTVVTSGAAACLVMLAAPAHAQAPNVASLSLEQLGGVEITSVSRRPEPLATAPASVYVISNEDIRRSAAPNLVESLRLAPNLEVARMNGFGYTVTARGFNSPESSNKLLVLIDGRSVYSPLASSVFWENTDVSLRDIDRIEVISGPGGTLYGANAVNGVINVVSKNAHDTLGGHVTLRAGTTDNKLSARYGFLPRSLPTFRAMVGDPSDRLPGVLGIGPSTARRLCAEYGDAAGILAALDAGRIRNPRLPPILRAGREALVLQEALGRLDRAVPGV